MADPAAVADELSALAAWRQVHGLGADADFAFCFSSLDEVQAELGPFAAGVWMSLRQSLQPGLAAAARSLYAQEDAMRATAARAAPPQHPAPTSVKPSVRPLAAKQSAVASLESTNEKFRSTLVGIMTRASRFRPQTRDEAKDVEESWKPMLDNLLATAEHMTLQRVQTTWEELLNWADAQGFAPAHLTASNLSRFYQECRAPSRVLPALQWMVRNLHLTYELQLCVPLRKRKRGNRHGVGARQAPVAEIFLLLMLEDALVTAWRSASPYLLAVLATWFQAFGVLRWAHVVRSTLLRVTQHTLYFVCSRGKQTQQRGGFPWSCPRSTPRACLDLSSVMQHLRERYGEYPFAALRQAEVTKTIQFLMQSHVSPTDLRSLTSKSWRQAPITWATMANLSPVQLVALGNWCDKFKAEASAMPLRYTGSKSSLLCRMMATSHGALWTWQS